MRNFSVDICGAQPNWVMSDFIETEITRIRKLVGDTAQVIGGVSGGVDSTVAAKLMKEAIGMAPDSPFPVGIHDEANNNIQATAFMLYSSTMVGLEPRVLNPINTNMS